MTAKICRIESGSEGDEIISAELSSALKKCVDGKKNTVITGVQGSGKTELLNGFFNLDYKREMAQKQKKLIYDANLSNKESADDILDYLAKTLIESLGLLLSDEMNRPSEELLKMKDQLGNLGTDKEDAESRLNDVIGVLHDQNHYFIILLMDSFERFTSSPTITMEHHGALRTLVAAGKVQCIVATDYDLSSDSLPEKVQGSYFVSLFKTNLIVTSFTETQAMAFLKRKQEFYDVKLEEKVMKQLYRLSGGIWQVLDQMAECALDQMEGNGGKLDESQVVRAAYRSCCPMYKGWCKYLTAKQAEVLQLITAQAKKNNCNALAVYDFTGDQIYDSTVDQLKNRGILRVATYMDGNGKEHNCPDHEVCMNSLLFQQYCMSTDLMEFVKNNPLLKEKVQQPEPVAETATPETSEHGTVIINKYTIDKWYESGAQDSSTNVHAGEINIVQNQVVNGITASEILGLLSQSGDSRSFFASRLTERIGACLKENPLPGLPNEDAVSEEEYARSCDEKFSRAGQALIQDVEVDEDGRLVNVEPDQLKTLDKRFEEARERGCRSNLTDEILGRQSERCRFYLKTSVVVEDALNFARTNLKDFSPQLVLYGKALEQALRDNLYELFHREEELSVYDTYEKCENPNSSKVFGKLKEDQAYIGNYAFLIDKKRKHLETLCQDCGIEERIKESFSSWSEWWNRLQKDIHHARRIRNSADHPNSTSPGPEDLDQMCKLLIGAEDSRGILDRLVVGKQLEQQLHLF